VTSTGRIGPVLERRDKRGRRIGYNWWREYITDLLWHAEQAWQALRESGTAIGTTAIAGADFDTAYYQLSEAEFRQLHPRPTLKQLLIEHAGMAERYEEQAA
jgi:hypothetical protein